MSKCTGTGMQIDTETGEWFECVDGERANPFVVSTALTIDSTNTNFGIGSPTPSEVIGDTDWSGGTDSIDSILIGPGESSFTVEPLPGALTLMASEIHIGGAPVFPDGTRQTTAMRSMTGDDELTVGAPWLLFALFGGACLAVAGMLVRSWWRGW